LAVEQAEGELPAKRAPKPNMRSLAAFSDSQPPIQVARKGKTHRKAVPPPLDSSPTLPLRRGAREAPHKVSSTPAASSPCTFDETPIPRRTKAPPPPFNPNSEHDKQSHHVMIYITPIIDDIRKEKDVITASIDINDIFRPDLEALRERVYKEYIKEWEERRHLKGAEKPIQLHWKVAIGNPKGQFTTVRVTDESSWQRVHASLRQLRHLGEKRTCYKLLIDALYQTFERTKTPPPVDSKNNKARPKTSRPVSLHDDSMLNDPESDLDEYEQDSDNLPASKTTKRPRDSITSRQLNLKKTRDASTDTKEATRQKIFVFHVCTEDRCDNYRGCCYKLKSTKTHHRVTALEQDEWARHVIIGFEDVSIDTPPAAWIAKYLEGYNRTNVKRQGNKKADTLTLGNTPSSDLTATKAVEVHNHFAAPVPPPQQAPSYANS